MADKGYDSDHIRQSLLFHCVLPVIPSNANLKKPVPHDRTIYKERNLVERMFNKLKQFRRVATRYDKTRKSFIAFLCIAAPKLFLNRSWRVKVCWYGRSAAFAEIEKEAC
ncbi:transposase [Kordiimonas sp.]|uniref:transposase n=1 Tax=Kordiimonas sp. TaxID=1970157 RepID=UPI003B52A871